MRLRTWASFTALATFGASAGYGLVLRGAVTLDLGIGRRTRSLGPLRQPIAAPRDVVFDVIAGPYLGRTPRAMEAKLRVIDRGSDLVLAAHYTPVALGLTAVTVETVAFQRPERVDFRLVRGPVPAVTETFHLEETPGGSEIRYTGEMATDLWRLGTWWGDVVAPAWERTVERSLRGIADEAARRARSRPTGTP